MTEAATAVRDYALHALGVARIISRAMAHNVGSIRVMQKLGLRHEGTQRSQLIKGRSVDLEMYGADRRDLS